MTQPLFRRDRNQAMNHEKSGLAGVIVLHESVPGHRNQSLGIAEELQRQSGAVLVEFEVPNLRGLSRLLKVKGKLKQLPNLSTPEILNWLIKAEGTLLLESVKSWLREKNIDTGNVLVISAGSRVAPYNYAVSQVLGCKSATLMTPKYLGAGPFDFSIIPVHDSEKEEANVLVTLGAPNRIRPEMIQVEKEKIQKEFPPASKSWGILIGGENSTFRIPPDWVERNLVPILQKAESEKVDIYLVTSRRTRPETEQAIKKTCSSSSSIKMLWLASERQGNPVPGVLGLSERVYCTEDSISMISETLTAGKPVVLLKTDYIQGPKEFIKKIGLKTGILSKRSAWKPDKFNLLYDQFREKGWLFDPQDEIKEYPKIQFHEAKRAAEWILSKWALKDL